MNLRTRNLDLAGALTTERLQVSGTMATDALSWLDDGPPAPLAIVGTEVRSRYVAHKGSVDEVAAQIIPIGTVVMWGGNAEAVPEGWALCDGTNGTPDLRGTFPLGQPDADAPLGDTSSASLHTAAVPLPVHSHTTSSARESRTTTPHTHAHSFSERRVDGLVPDAVRGTEKYTAEGFVTNQTFSDSFLRDFAHPLSTAWYTGEANVRGVLALPAGSHTHRVSARHSHPTAEAGTNAAPSVDIQPQYATIHFIIKVSHATPQPSQCLLPHEPPCEPLDCVYRWGPYSACPADPAPGTVQTSTMIVDQAPRGEGQPCPTVTTRTLPCPIPCKVSDWGAWSACPTNATATTMQTRTRTITQQPAHGGTACPVLSESRNCPVHCGFTWGGWSACSAGCGDGAGTQTRSPTITRQPLHGGDACPAPETRSCQLECNYVFSTVGTHSATITASGAGTLHILVVAGGGGTGQSFMTEWVPGGGGAGGVVYRRIAFTGAASKTVSVVVGAGGAAQTVLGNAGNNGGNSSCGTVSALGGGGGGSTYERGKAGGSGGGDAAANSTMSVTAAGAGTQGQGFAGGLGYRSTSRSAGGGGGAGSAGSRASDAPLAAGGAGGAGLYFGHIFGTALGASGTFGAGGRGGAAGGVAGSNGAANTGNGASGGGGNTASRAGGSGVVILRAVGLVKVTASAATVRQTDGIVAASSSARLYETTWPSVTTTIALAAL